MSLRRRALGFVGGTAALLATSLAQAQCSKDTDCKGDRVCDGGSCVTAAPPAAAAPVATPPATAAPLTPEPALAAPAVVPPLDLTPPPPKMQRHSKGMMVGGIVMVSLTPVALLVASVAALGKGVCGIDNYDRTDSNGNTVYGHSDCSGYNPAIYGALGTALVLAGVGIPLIVIGASKEPVNPSAPTATLSPWATPTSAGLGLRVEL